MQKLNLLRDTGCDPGNCIFLPCISEKDHSKPHVKPKSYQGHTNTRENKDCCCCYIFYQIQLICKLAAFMKNIIK